MVAYLSIGFGGVYQLNGGTLQINGGFVNSGVFNGGNSSAVLSGSSCIVDLSAGALQNVGDTHVSMDANSLLIVPPGFNPSTAFGSYTSLGLTHTAGTTLVVPAGQGFGGVGSINDPVNCQGTIAAAAGSFINLKNGLVLSGTGSVSLGSGTLTITGTASDISGGAISAYGQNIGGLFTQSGGTNSITYLSINYGGHYQLSGGTLQINGGLVSSGTFDGGNSSAVLSGSNCIVNFSTGTLQNVGATIVSMDANSLLIVPPGLNPSTAFGSCTCLGLPAHTTGTPLVVPAGQGFGGLGSINDSVTCHGTITAASGGSINLNNGLVLSGTGAVSLGGGTLTTNDTASGISSGSLSANGVNIGTTATGVFTQSGGTNTISNALYLGSNAGSSGTYSLSGAGQLSAPNEYVAYNYGTGTFAQSGGTNAIAGYLSLGYNSGSSGTYILSGTGLLTAEDEDMGDISRHGKLHGIRRH